MRKEVDLWCGILPFMLTATYPFFTHINAARHEQSALLVRNAERARKLASCGECHETGCPIDSIIFEKM